MLFPIGDENKHRGTAYISLLLILANLFVFFYFQQAGQNEDFIYGWSIIPDEITSGEDLTSPQQVQTNEGSITVPQAPGPQPIYLTIISAMFMHGGYLHLFGNLLYLWIFGDNIEHRFGGLPFLFLYITAGVAGSLLQVFLSPETVIPNLGASGAISGVLGAYLVMFPTNRVQAIFFYFIVSVPAVVMIGLWVVFQFVNGLGAVMAAQETVGGVAYGAHIGGFVAGVVLALFLRLIIREDQAKSSRRKRR